MIVIKIDSQSLFLPVQLVARKRAILLQRMVYVVRIGVDMYNVTDDADECLAGNLIRVYRAEYSDDDTNLQIDED